MSAVAGNEPPPLLELRDVRFGYVPERPLLAGGDLRLDVGDFAVLEGPSGSGKSTLLRLICRFEEPSSGEIRVEGKPQNQWPPALLRRRVHLLAQVPVLFEGTLRDNLLYPFRVRAAEGAPQPDDAALREDLARLKLERGLDDDAAGLSPGEKQRVALARAMRLGPRLLLMDEPTSALDPESCRIVDGISESLHIDRGVAVLMVSHRGFAPERVTPRRIRLEAGKLVEDGG